MKAWLSELELELRWLFARLATACAYFQIKLNGTLLPINDFKDYVNLYPVGEAIKNQQFETVGPWTVCVTTSNYGVCASVWSAWASVDPTPYGRDICARVT